MSTLREGHTTERHVPVSTSAPLPPPVVPVSRIEKEMSLATPTAPTPVAHFSSQEGAAASLVARPSLSPIPPILHPSALLTARVSSPVPWKIILLCIGILFFGTATCVSILHAYQDQKSDAFSASQARLPDEDRDFPSLHP